MAATLWDLLFAKRWDDLCKRLNSHPEECKEISPNGCCLPPDMATMEVLKAFPGVAREKNAHGPGFLPLHFCCRHAAPAEVTMEVLKAFPGAAREMKEGMLPLHICCRYAAPAKATMEVLKAFPGAAREKNAHGFLPLHFCCRHAAPVEATMEVLMAFPGAAREKTWSGFLPLHTCCRRAAPVKVTINVLQAFPGAAREKDRSGFLPLHICCRHAAPAEAAIEVLHEFPEAARERNPRPIETFPIDDAVATSAAPKLIEQLMQACPMWTQSLQRGGFQDTKTGLPNKDAQDFQLLTMEMDPLDVEDAETALVEIDLRNFKTVNDQLGHGMGDSALKEFAKQLEKWVRYPHTRAFRTGGDEFSIVLQEADAGTCSAILKGITTYSAKYEDVLVSARAWAFSKRGGWVEETESFTRWNNQMARFWLKAAEKVLHAEDHPYKRDRTVLGYPVQPCPGNRPVFWKALDKSGNAQVWCGNPELDEGSCGFAQVLCCNLPKVTRANLEQERNSVPELNDWQYWVDQV